MKIFLFLLISAVSANLAALTLDAAIAQKNKMVYLSEQEYSFMTNSIAKTKKYVIENYQLEIVVTNSSSQVIAPPVFDPHPGYQRCIKWPEPSSYITRSH